MKSDINLMPDRAYNRLYFFLLIIFISILIGISAILIPIRKRNRLLSESYRISQKLNDNEELNKQYLDLENYSEYLLNGMELINEINSQQIDFIEAFDIINDSMSPNIEIFGINISGNILSIKGLAPNHREIADSIIRLQEDKKVSSVEIQEISLDRECLKQIFDLKCIRDIKDVDSLIEESYSK